MLKSNLVVGASYLDRSGVVSRIVEEITPADHGYKQGYRFRNQDEDSFLPNGQFDADEETSWDLVEHVSQNYLVTEMRAPKSHVILAIDPNDAICQFKEKSQASVDKVYKLDDVTPKKEEAADD